MPYPVDVRLPHIASAVDTSLMQEKLQQALFTPTAQRKNRLRIVACHIDEQRYKPGESFVLSYRLQLLDTVTGTTRQQIVCARLDAAAPRVPALHWARSNAVDALEGIRPVVYLPELAMTVWSFPHDRKLTHLPRLLDLPFLYDLFSRRLVSLNLHREHRLRHLRAAVVHYIPERSCMIRYQFDRENRQSMVVQPMTIYGKVYRDESGATTYAMMQQLAEGPGAPMLAAPLGYDPELRVLWQSALPGQPIRREDLLAPSGLDVMERMAVCVAAFHSRREQCKNQFTLADIDSQFGETCDFLAHTHPHLLARVHALVCSLRTQVAGIRFTEVPTTLLHRDLKVGNFVFDGEQMGLVDLDCVCMGDPLSDLGSFIANVYLHGILVGCPESRIRQGIEVFCRVYAARVAWQVSQKRLNWYIAASFIYEIIRRSSRQWHRQRLAHMQRYIDLCAQYCCLTG